MRDFLGKSGIAYNEQNLEHNSLRPSQCAVFYYIMHAAMHIRSYICMQKLSISLLIYIRTYVLHNYIICNYIAICIQMQGYIFKLI